VLALRGVDGAEYGVWLPASLISRAIIVLSGAYHALVQSKQKLPSEEQPPEFQAFGLWRSRLHVDSAGNPALVLQLDGQLELALKAGPREANELLVEAQRLVAALSKMPPEARH
jgi:hypothetical protein